MTKSELQNRTKGFGIATLRFVRTLPADPITTHIAQQLARSATAVGANYRSSCRAKSGADFISKMTVVEEESDEALYADMNERFHTLILNEAGSSILNAALERNSRIPFAGAQALAFDKSNLEQMYDMLHYAHRQHHHIVDAIESGQAARAETLMREHAIAVKESINMAEFQVATDDAGVRPAALAR